MTFRMWMPEGLEVCKDRSGEWRTVNAEAWGKKTWFYNSLVDICLNLPAGERLHVLPLETDE